MSATILIVEDESIVAENLQDELETLGYSVCGIASSGEQALKLEAKHAPDLVLMDIMLAGTLDGIATAAKMHERRYLPVVYLTAYSDSATLQRAQITEPFGYLIKPYKERELHSTLEMALYKHRMEQKLRDHERWLDTVLSSVGDGVVTVDVLGNLTSFSPVAEQLCGWPEAEAQGKPVQEVFVLEEGSDEGCLLDQLDFALRGRHMPCLEEERPVLLGKDGERRIVDIGAAPLQDDTGDVTGAVLTIRDISARHQAELALAEARTTLVQLLTPREAEVLQLMVDGTSTKEIAFALAISPRTVESHRQNIMRKFGLHDTPMLIRFSLVHHLVEVPYEPPVNGIGREGI